MQANRIQTDSPVVMGILNVTPDSFSDGGANFEPQAAVAAALEMVADGADIIDIGGESTRPGSKSVSLEEEIRRVVPVISAVRKQVDVPISVDTTKLGVAQQAVDAGATIINDVSMLRNGVELAVLAAKSECDLMLMHSRGTPDTMRSLINYDDVVVDVIREIGDAIALARDAGVKRDRLWVDPGIGFAKTAEQSAALIARLDEIVAMGYSVLVGPSRKSFIGELTGASVDERLAGTVAAVCASILAGAKGVRVHDVREARQAVDLSWHFMKNRKVDV